MFKNYSFNFQVPGFDYDSSTYIYEILNSIKMKVAPFDKCREKLGDIGRGETSFCGTFTRREICKGDEGGLYKFGLIVRQALEDPGIFSIKNPQIQLLYYTITLFQ